MLLLRGPARSLVLEIKYHKGLHLMGDFEQLFRINPRLLDHVRNTVLVPVPLHPRKKRHRGYNQSEELSKALVKAVDGKASVALLLRRLVDTGTQTALDRHSRYENLKDAFAAAPDAVVDRETHYVLVDDVFTTGATLNRCALALRRAGARKIDVVTFAHG